MDAFVHPPGEGGYLASLHPCCVCKNGEGVPGRPGIPEKIGAGDEIRTHDINLGKVALYP